MKRGTPTTGYCANVRPPIPAQSHIRTEARTLGSQSEPRESLKALANKALRRAEARTLSRTMHAQSAHSAVMCGPETYELAPVGRRTATPEEEAELRLLVPACGERYAFTADEHREALALALGDPEAALTCFRAIAAELGI